MPRTADSVNLRLIGKVSSMYYDQQLNQQEIADRLRLSRPRVSRLLKQARELGVVKISVVTPEGTFPELERELEERYGLKEALIADADAGDSKETVHRRLGYLAARYLHRTTTEGEVIGVTWGGTLQAMVDAMPPKSIRGVHVVQTLGGVGPAEARAHASDISRRLAQRLDARLTLLPAPGITGSAEARKVLVADRQVQASLALLSTVDTLYVGLGSLDSNPLLASDNSELARELAADIRSLGAVGDIAMRFFDAQGRLVPARMHELVVGITDEQIRHVPTVVGVSGGPGKLAVVKATLSGRYVQVLITDRQTAERLV